MRGFGPALFDAAATASRTLPHFRGKWQLADLLLRVLRPLRGSADPLCTVHMKDGSLMTWDVRDAAEGRAILLGQWDAAVRDAILAMLPSDAVVLDVGASVGAWTVPLARALRSGGFVHAFEPVPENFRRLEAVVVRNALANVALSAIALGEQEGHIGMWLRSSVSGAGSGTAAVVPDGANAHLRVPLRTLDAWEAEHPLARLDFMKVDVEGAELMVLTGGERTIARWRPIILAEFDEYWMSTHRQTQVDAVRWAQAHDYRLLCWDRRRRKFAASDRPAGDATLLVPAERSRPSR